MTTGINSYVNGSNKGFESPVSLGSIGQTDVSSEISWTEEKGASGVSKTDLLEGCLGVSKKAQQLLKGENSELKVKLKESNLCCDGLEEQIEISYNSLRHFQGVFEEALEAKTLVENELGSVRSELISAKAICGSRGEEIERLNRKVSDLKNSLFSIRKKLNGSMKHKPLETKVADSPQSVSLNLDDFQEETLALSLKDKTVSVLSKVIRPLIVIGGMLALGILREKV